MEEGLIHEKELDAICYQRVSIVVCLGIVVIAASIIYMSIMFAEKIWL